MYYELPATLIAVKNTICIRWQTRKQESYLRSFKVLSRLKNSKSIHYFKYPSVSVLRTTSAQEKSEAADVCESSIFVLKMCKTTKYSLSSTITSLEVSISKFFTLNGPIFEVAAVALFSTYGTTKGFYIPSWVTPPLG